MRRDQSMRSAACSLASSTSCNRSQTPACCQPALAAHTRAAAHFLREHLPRDTGLQHEQDVGQHGSGVYLPRTRRVRLIRSALLYLLCAAAFCDGFLSAYFNHPICF